MPRIRSIKPEFWQDQRLARMPALTRLVYMCLWSMADDEGRVEGDAETVWHFGFPRESVEDITSALRTLVECSRVVLYRGENGLDYAFLPTFTKHQRIDRPSPSKFPVPPILTPIRRTFDEPSTNAREGSDGIGEDRKGEEGSAPRLAVASLHPLAEAWNSTAERVGLPLVTACSKTRLRHIANRLREADVETWGRAFALIAADPFCRGENDRGWRADFDYALRPEKSGKWLDLARNGNGHVADDGVTPSERRMLAEMQRMKGVAE